MGLSFGAPKSGDIGGEVDFICAANGISLKKLLCWETLNVPKALRIRTTVLPGGKTEFTDEELEVARAEHKG